MKVGTYAQGWVCFSVQCNGAFVVCLSEVQSYHSGCDCNLLCTHRELKVAGALADRRNLVKCLADSTSGTNI